MSDDATPAARGGASGAGDDGASDEAASDHNVRSDAAGLDGVDTDAGPGRVGGRPPGHGATTDVERVAVGDLLVEVALDLTVDGEPLRVRSRDGRLELSAERLGPLRDVAALRGSLQAPVGEPLAGALLGEAPLGVSVRGVEVARVDPGVPAGPLSRALGVAPARLDLRGVVRAAWGDALGALRDGVRDRR